ncbi:hypothetical protein GCM10022254_52540 [Actinomadura meridiana]|uniref:Uncharacterized protein n=1 Tax=Actinomadura meridiana TaxID=559626 RepID=A0ABP8CDX3_9ACTN
MSESSAELRTLEVAVQEGQYHIEAAARRDDPWPPPQDGLTTGEDHWTGIVTGTQWGPVTVLLQTLAQRPDAVSDGWEMVVERDLVTEESGIEVRSIFREEAVGNCTVPPGRYRLRIHVRGRADAAIYNMVESPLETHLVQLWPSPQSQAPEIIFGPDTYATRDGSPALSTSPAPVSNAREDTNAFLGRLTTYLADEAGIGQFLIVDALHSALDTIQPFIPTGSRTIYLHNGPEHDPGGTAHTGITFVRANLTDPDEILTRAMEHLDFDQPVALALLSVLPDIPDDARAYQYARRLGGPLAEGSYLAVTHSTLGYYNEGEGDPPPRIGGSGQRLRHHQEILNFMGGFVLVVTGLVEITRWIPGPQRNYLPPTGEFQACAVGRRVDDDYFWSVFDRLFPGGSLGVRGS